SSVSAAPHSEGKANPGKCLKPLESHALRTLRFVVKLGQDPENLVLHFNPHFDPQKCRNTIVCNSKENGLWGEEEESISKFPFEQGGRVQLSFAFLTSEIMVLLDDKHEISFPNRLGLRVLEYMAVEGGFRIRALRFLES
uniref:Galectin n=1 Tax=Podarcis muralis TaxID=64176 RepID=A0A670IML0_PODMU